MSLDGKDLKLAREHMNLTQQGVADRLQIGLTTYQRWEQCKRLPHPDMRQKVLDFFKDAFRELGISTYDARIMTRHDSSRTPSCASSVPQNRVITFADNHLGSRLFFLVTPPYASYQDIHDRMADILKEHSTMNNTNKNDQISRREALIQVVALPVGALQLKIPGQTVKSGLHELAITTCAAGIAGCYELRKTGEAVDVATAFDGVSLYLPVLDDIMQYSSHYRQKACDLAARCAILKTLLCWHCASHAAATYCAQQAVEYSKQSGDINLQLSAYSKLAWAYFCEHELKYPLALDTALEARHVLEMAEKKHIPIAANVRDGTYSTLAMMQTVNKQNCDEALGNAGELDPGWECSAFMEFTPVSMDIETGLICLHKGEQAAAMTRFTNIVDPNDLTLRDPQGYSDVSSPVGTIIHMTESVLSGKDRDMEEVIRLWTAGIQGAVALRSEHFFNDALTMYKIMKYIWPKERRIEELVPLTVHWLVARK